jgi:hypothetical protein
MQINNGKSTRPVISTFDGMARLGARFTAGDIGIDQDANNPQIYFCTPADGVSVPIGITPSSATFSSYFTPYKIEPILLKNGMKPFYTALGIGDADKFVKNPNLDASKYEDKIPTLPVLAAYVDKYFEGVSATGGFRIVDDSNYLDIVGKLDERSKTYIIGTWPLPSSEDNERTEFLPDEVEVTSSDTALLKVYVGETKEERHIIKEFILYRKYAVSNYVVRYLKVGSDVWKNITAVDTWTYSAKIKSTYDRLQRAYKALLYKYDQINQVYKHNIVLNEGYETTELDLTRTFQINSGNLIVNLNLLQNDILAANSIEESEQLRLEDVDNVVVRFNIVSEGLVSENEDTGKICDSLFVDFETLLNGVNWLRGGNSYYRVNVNSDGTRYLSIPCSNLEPSATTLTEEQIRSHFMVYVVNIQLKKTA